MCPGSPVTSGLRRGARPPGSGVPVSVSARCYLATVEARAQDRIIAAQRSWAARNDIEIDEHTRTVTLEDNLFQPLHEATRAEFGAGAGDELGEPGRPGKLASLYSSSALATNMFDFWRGRNATALFDALGFDAGGSVVRFEAKHPTGLQGTPPHLDIELTDGQGTPVAVESKFTEPYGRIHSQFRPVYFERESLWEGMPRLRRLAERMDDGSVRFEHLHAAQLVKHILGLSHSYGGDGFALMYLWYFVDGPEGERHQSEVEEFEAMLGGEVRFMSRTYQGVLGRFAPDDSTGEWHRYQTERYLATG